MLCWLWDVPLRVTAECLIGRPEEMPEREEVLVAWGEHRKEKPLWAEGKSTQKILWQRSHSPFSNRGKAPPGPGKVVGHVVSEDMPVMRRSDSEGN